MDTRAFLKSGNVNYHANIELAIDAYTKGIEFPDDNKSDKGKCLVRRAELHARKKEHASAIIDYKKALEICDLTTLTGVCLKGLGYSYHQLHDLDSAISTYLKAFEHLPDNDKDKADCYTKLGLVYQDKNNLQSAISYYSLAIQIFEEMKPIPKDTYPGDAYFHRGEAYLALGEKDKAFADYKIAFEESGSMQNFDYFKRGQANLALNRYGYAIIDFSVAHSDSNDNHEKAICRYYQGLAHKLRSDAEFKHGPYQTWGSYHYDDRYAKKNLRKAIKRFPDTEIHKVYAYEAWAEIYIKQEHYKKAIAKFKEAIKRLDNNPEHKAACILKCAKVYFIKKNYKSAIEHCNAAIETFSQDNNKAAVYFLLGEIYEAKHDYATASEQFDKSSKLYAADHISKKFSQYKHVCCLYALKQHKLAIVELTEIIPQFADDHLHQAKCYFNRAQCHAALGDFQAAIKDFITAIHIDAKNSKVIANLFSKNDFMWIIKNHSDFYQETIKPALNEKTLSLTMSIENKIMAEEKNSQQGKRIFGLFPAVSGTSEGAPASAYNYRRLNSRRR